MYVCYLPYYRAVQPANVQGHDSHMTSDVGGVIVTIPNPSYSKVMALCALIATKHIFFLTFRFSENDMEATVHIVSDM